MVKKQKPYCLVVDDDEDCREIGKILCKSMGMEVAGAGDGLEALDVCKMRLPDLILLDWMMPKMDGIHFLEALRKIKDGDKVNVLMCSALAEKKDQEMAMSVGANGYLAKPFNPPELMENILNTHILDR